MTSFTRPYIVAEAAQGFEGDATLAHLLVKASAAANADAIKFQLVFADDLAVPEYAYYDLFEKLEMSAASWRAVRDDARDRKLEFFVDVFGARSLSLARDLAVDGVKLHSTCFFDDGLIADIAALPIRLMLSIGGIEPVELGETIEKHGLAERSSETVIMYGFQAEPTPLASNNLRRIPEIAKQTGLEIGFMDHSEGLGDYAISLSAVALGFGVRVFEKHISLDHALALEDHVSALTPSEFSSYVSSLTELAKALGDGALALSEEERGYRGRSLKRVIATRDVIGGAVLTGDDVTLLRPSIEQGYFRTDEVIGRRANRDIAAGSALRAEDLA